jgi:hypothetical protein
VKLVRLGRDEIFHRYHTPKWASRPTSGAGAAAEGGRFNRPGVEALYLSRAPQTALEEYKQGATDHSAGHARRLSRQPEQRRRFFGRLRPDDMAGGLGGVGLPLGGTSPGSSG